MGKKNSDELILTFYDQAGGMLLERRLTSVKLAEQAVLRLSMEFFSDPEPCMIHRSAVMSRMYMELLEYFLPRMREGACALRFADLPERLAAFFDVPGWANVAAKPF